MRVTYRVLTDRSSMPTRDSGLVIGQASDPQGNPERIHGVPARMSTESIVIEVVQWLRLGIDAAGAFVLAGGVAVALIGFAGASLRQRSPDFTTLRLRLARYLALALELQLGADILSTAVAPTWDQIGKLGAIASIRTGLNFFLMRELRETGQMPAVDLSR